MTKPELEKILFLDIETVPAVYRYDDLNDAARELWNKKWQYNKEVSPEQQYVKAGIYAEFAKVIVIGLGFYNQGKFRVKTLASDNESEILRQFSDLLKQHFNTTSHLLCAHNGKEFDFPFLCRRFLINNLPLPKILQIQGLRPWEVKHIDTMDLWKFGDVKNFSSLNLLAHVLGVPSPKDDMDGSMVGKTYYEDHDLQKIETYCKKDVITLARVFNRFAGTGNLNEEDIIFV
ncbi:MAG TPA: 3'-5' exonuclease [Bacteroidia bacterium]|nr:3'-5' exonuclease [Bacteroidia bacterium]